MKKTMLLATILVTALAVVIAIPAAAGIKEEIATLKAQKDPSGVRRCSNSSFTDDELLNCLQELPDKAPPNKWCAKLGRLIPTLEWTRAKCVEQPPGNSGQNSGGQSGKKKPGRQATTQVVMVHCAYTGTDLPEGSCPAGCPALHTLSEDGQTCTPPTCKELLCAEDVDEALNAKFDEKFAAFTQGFWDGMFPWLIAILALGVLNFLFLIIILVRTGKKKEEAPQKKDDPATRPTTHLGKPAS